MKQGNEDVRDAALAPPVPAAASLDRAGPSGVESLRSPSYSLRDAVARRAASFKQQHFQAGDAGVVAVESEGLRQLRDLCERLHKDEHCVAALLEVSLRLGCLLWPHLKHCYRSIAGSSICANDV
jgi:hypothetical protein